MPCRSFCRYLVLAEDTSAPGGRSLPARLPGAAKTLFWLTISVLMGLGLGQLG